MTKKKSKVSQKKQRKTTPTKKKTIKKLTKKGEKNQVCSVSITSLLCSTHTNKYIEFICLKNKCFKELCSLCILDHKDHIDEIQLISNVLAENMQYFENWDVTQEMGIIRNQQGQ